MDLFHMLVRVASAEFNFKVLDKNHAGPRPHGRTERAHWYPQLFKRLDSKLTRRKVPLPVGSVH